VLESFSPGTMAKLGLDYATVSAGRPELIMLSASLLGQSGPMADFAGFGQQGVGLAGISTVTGWPGRRPINLGAYTDVVAPKYGIAALAAAVHRRRQTGRGVHLDLAQVEASIRFIEPLVLDQTVNGRTATPVGLDSPVAAPHGAYPVAGHRRWIAVAVETPEQWRALCGMAPLSDFSGPEFDELERRRASADGIDAALSEWTKKHDGAALEARLCGAGIPAAVVARTSEAAADDQLWQRGFFVAHDHPAMGPCHYEAQPTAFAGSASGPHAPAPCLGQHTDHVLVDLLGYPAAEVAALRAAGALD